MSDGSRDTITLPREVVEEALKALGQAYSTALTVRRGQIDAPYSDDPAWTPYTRWVRPMGRRTHDAHAALLRAIKVVEPGYERTPLSTGSLVALVRDGEAAKLCDFCSSEVSQ
jgi:hypothetical protein